jgi:uncharacterized protein (DUF305 family)
MRSVFALVLLAGLTGAAQAQMTGMQHAAPAGEAASTRDYRAAMAKMMHGMDIPYTGDADRDFVAGMLPHHQGAVDMARIELRDGHDPELRKLAEGIIAAQEKEIAFMQAWQARHR